MLKSPEADNMEIKLRIGTTLNKINEAKRINPGGIEHQQEMIKLVDLLANNAEAINILPKIQK